RRRARGPAGGDRRRAGQRPRAAVPLPGAAGGPGGPQPLGAAGRHVGRRPDAYRERVRAGGRAAQDPRDRYPSYAGPVNDVGPRFVKGHGTGNDFVLLPDPDGTLHLTPSLVAAVCDRRTGIGADGVLRVVRSSQAPEALHLAGDATWFM